MEAIIAVVAMAAVGLLGMWAKERVGFRNGYVRGWDDCKRGVPYDDTPRAD